jgi:hypothetical protein
VRNCGNSMCTQLHADDYRGQCPRCGFAMANAAGTSQAGLLSRWMGQRVEADIDPKSAAVAEMVPEQRVNAVKSILFGDE